jgi:hypothetical protein
MMLPERGTMMLEIKGTEYQERPGRVGTQRPSAFMFTAGVGGLLDLPHMTVVIAGLDRWDISNTRVVEESRLLDAVRARLGDQIELMRTPPHLPEDNDRFGAWTRVGVPVTPFPRWLRCTKCSQLGTMDSGSFELDFKPVNTEATQFRHRYCSRAGKQGKAPRAVAARFVFACDAGHLDDFPFNYFVHGPGGTCAQPNYSMEDLGQGLSPTVRVSCKGCSQEKSMVAAFGDRAQRLLPACRGRNPHLGTFESSVCTAQARAMVLGASNLWFGQVLSSLYLPDAGGDLPTLVRDNWSKLNDLESEREVTLVLRDPELHELTAFSSADVLSAIADRRQPAGGEVGEPDLKRPEWEAFTVPASGLAPGDSDFRLRPVAPPASFSAVERVVLVERLREARAFVGFTRIGPFDPESSGGPQPGRLARGNVTWIPAVEGRGEGIFLQLDSTAVTRWEDRVRSAGTIDSLQIANTKWNRNLGRPDHHGWIGERGILLHTLSHALIRQLALDCGYAAASLSERIYHGTPDQPQEGLLIYTTAADTEGTLGGLVALGEPANLDRLIAAALSQALHCTADPLCGENHPTGDGPAINGAACHLCSFTAETTCEYNNRLLDRRVLVSVGDSKTPFFE